MHVYNVYNVRNMIEQPRYAFSTKIETSYLDLQRFGRWTSSDFLSFIFLPKANYRLRGSAPIAISTTNRRFSLRLFAWELPSIILISAKFIIRFTGKLIFLRTRVINSSPFFRVYSFGKRFVGLTSGCFVIIERNRRRVKELAGWKARKVETRKRQDRDRTMYILASVCSSWLMRDDTLSSGKYKYWISSEGAENQCLFSRYLIDDRERIDHIYMYICAFLFKFIAHSPVDSTYQQLKYYSSMAEQRVSKCI